VRIEKLKLKGLMSIALPLIVLVLTAKLILASTPTLAIPSEADEVKGLIKKAAKLIRRSDLVNAEELLRKAVALDPSRSDAKVELGFVLTKQRRLTEAYDLLLPIAQSEPKNTRAFAVFGTTLLAAGRFNDAKALFYTAITNNKKEHLAWAGFGMVDFYENRINDSLENLREAVYRAPSEPDYVFALAQVSARSERYKEAADAYKQFLQISESTDADRRARIRGLIAFLSYLGQTDRLYALSGAENSVIPFELVGNRPVLNVRVNGRTEVLRFVLDTGSGISVVSAKTAKRMKIKPITKGGHARGLGGDGRFEIVYGMLREVTLGGVNVRNVPVYLREFHQTTNEVDGYIGLALISKFLTTVDYGNSTMSLTKRETDVRAFTDSGNLSLPLRLTSSGFLSGQVQLEGVESPLNFIVDTGASISVISDEVANVDNISRFAAPGKLQVIGSAGVIDDKQTYKLPKVSFGSHSRRDVMAVALDLGLINEASGFEQAGILGGNFLKNYRLTFDFKNSKVIFTPLKPDKD
jgi:thioredoxin-like negative regulator of GroEL/predicted aspartyl protease